ncbi:MAG TPA: long-chain fatty acid--CoA ligase [Thermoleophilaceae bacterium]|nr:long-chain fatty acid--CoA ligase [Thermoleophilaceae bacterium]
METTTAAAPERGEARALGESTVCGAFQATAEDHADRTALRTKGDDFSITWSEYADRVRAAAGGLAGLGLGQGETMAIMLTNRPEFHVADTAAMHLGAIPFSVYNTYSPEQIEYLISDSESRIFVTERAFLDRVLEVGKRCDSLAHVVVVDGDGGGAEGSGTLSLAELPEQADAGFDFDSAWRAVGPDDLLTLIYTSGTTGPPKGVEVMHRNFMAAAKSFDQIIRFPDGSRVVSYLPMAHIAERACSHYLPMAFGFETTCCPDPREIAGYLPEVRPNWFFSVPRIWEKVKAALEAGMAGEEDEQKKQATSWALDVGRRKVRAEQAGEEVPEDLRAEYEKADQMVLSKIRERVGLDQAQSVNFGAAPTPPEVIEFFHSIGIPLGELWGLSETCGAGTCNRPEHVKIGTVGPPSPGVEIRLADDGEVLLKSDVVMRGYRNMPDKTAETIDEDGWLHTGDIGEFDEDGFLKIVDRKKELIINAAGKNMSPANIEAKAKASSPLIGQVAAIGDRRSYVTALVTLDPDAAPGFARQHGLTDDSFESLSQEQAVIDEVQRGIDRANEDLARVEQIKRFKILPTDWEPGGDELTPTMKLKRKPIAEKYADEIEELYEE